MAHNLNTLFAALADPTRRAVIEALLDGPAPVSDLHGSHDMALPTFLKHLKVMEAGGLVTSTKKGRVRTVALQPDALSAGADWLNKHKAMWDGRMDRIERLAIRLDRTKS
ncbi:MAG: metalloregulator ArsR/SmtB family transcription factor [Pseudomonadota bacterium]